MVWGKCNDKSDGQPLAYDTVRDKTGLGSQHAILATHQAAQAITGYLERGPKARMSASPLSHLPR